MPRSSPPKHRHDGSSPLPLGMDWSPPPKKWDGRSTVWPHNPHTGWSYCIMVPSWKIQTEPRASNDSFLNPIVFYRIHIGIQSPEGFSTSHEILRRFSDFLKLFSALKRAFPKKDIPAAPPKHALSRINSSRLLLEERRHALEEWMGRLLSDIDLSRSASVAAFLELEVAARSAYEEVNNSLKSSSSSLPVRPNSGSSDVDCLTTTSTSHSVASEQDNAYETSYLGISQGKARISEVASVHDLTNPIGATDNGVVLGEIILDHPENSLMSKLHHRKENLVIDRDTYYGSSSKEIFVSRDKKEPSEQDNDRLSGHSRKFSSESIGSDISSIRGSELSLPGVTNSIWDSSVDLPGTSEAPNAMEEMQFLNDSQILLPVDQRYKLNRVLVTMQRRLLTSKTDMEDLIARLDQETAVKEYLTTKVKDLEVELEATKQKSKEHLQHAILTERERVTQLQWGMDELRRGYMEMESKLKFEQSERIRAETEKITTGAEKELLLKELDSKQEQLENSQKHLGDLEVKSKADIKVLVKEVKFLRNSQAEIKEVLNQSLKEKAELERTLRNEKQRSAHVKMAKKKLLHECGVLRQRLQECSVNFLAEEEDKFTVSASLSDALDLLATSDNRIGLLLAEAQLLGRDDELHANVEEASETGGSINGEDPTGTDDEQLHKMLADAFVDNARLRKQVNSVIRRALKTMAKPNKDEVTSRKTLLNNFLER